MQLVGYQGDLAFFRTTVLPSGLTQDHGTAAGVLARGTQSGHAHQVDDPAAAAVFLDPKTGMRWLDVTSRVSVSHGRARGFGGKEADHDYHKTVWLEPGVYAVGVVHETDWLSKTIRQVVD